MARVMAHRPAADRGVTPVLGSVLLVLLTVAVALSVATLLTTAGTDLDETPTASLSLTVDHESDRIALTHSGGDALNVSELDVTVEIDGSELAQQPPVPFFAARGFESGPTGPFNSRSPDEWRVGETAGIRLASTNAPRLSRGSEVTVVVTAGGAVVHEATVTA